MPVAPAESLARKWFLPRNRMSELFTYGSVGGVGYNLGGNSGGRPAPTRKEPRAGERNVFDDLLDLTIGPLPKR